MKKVVTVMDLMKQIGHTQESVKYGHSRSVLNSLDKPVLGFGVGYAGFIAIFENGNGFVQAVNYSVKNIGHKWSNASFYILRVQDAIDEIQTNKFLVEKELNTEALQNFKEKKPMTYAGELWYKKQNNSDGGGYKVRQFKNGNIRVYKFWRKEACWGWPASKKDFFKALQEKDFTENTIPPKLITQMEKERIVEEI